MYDLNNERTVGSCMTYNKLTRELEEEYDIPRPAALLQRCDQTAGAGADAVDPDQIRRLAQEVVRQHLDARIPVATLADRKYLQVAEITSRDLLKAKLAQ